MKREELVEKSHRYIDAFRQENYEMLAELIDEEVTQIEPGKQIEGRDALFDFIESMYKAHKEINFVTTHIFADEQEQKSVIEFWVAITLEDSSIRNFRGCDHLQWNKNEKIQALEAFLYQL